MALRRLSDLNHSKGIILGGLERLTKAIDFMGNPLASFKVVHVAGTNGKGSVTSKLAKVLSLNGYKTGTFMSPHVNTFRERISINNEMISKDAAISQISHIFDIIDKHSLDLTYFEVIFLSSLLHFRNEGVEWAVLEAGVGGTGDATNIVHPSISVITSVDLDHMSLLGNTIEEIATNKAGIIKYPAPVVIGPHSPVALLTSLAKSKGCDYVIVPKVFDSTYNEENSLIVSSVCKLLVEREGIKISPESLREGLKFKPLCRFEIFDKSFFLNNKHFKPNEMPESIVLDVAHNPHGLNKLMHSLRKQFPSKKIRLIIGISSNKDANQCFQEIINAKDIINSIVLTVSSSTSRGFNADDLHVLLNDALMGGKMKIDNCKYPSVHSAVRESLRKAKEKDEILVICGSFFIMEEARNSLCLGDEIDGENMNEAFTKITKKN